MAPTGFTSWKGKKILKDTEVFRPSRNQKSEEWPDFLLEYSTVLMPNGKELADLLQVGQSGPFTVRGKLVVEKDNIKYLNDKKYASGRWIELTSVSYATSCGPTVIWCDGESGYWFEIEPAPEYQHVFDNMIHAVGFGFDLLEFHEEYAKVENAFPSLDDVLLHVGSRNGSGLTYHQLRASLLSHAPYLVTHLKDGKVLTTAETELAHCDSPFFQWLISERPNVWKKLQKTPAMILSARPPTPEPAPAKVYAPILPAVNTPLILPPKLHQPRLSNKDNSLTLTDLPVPTPAMNAQLPFIIAAIESQSSPGKPVSFGKLNNYMYSAYRGPSKSRGPRFAKAMVCSHAAAIMSYLSRDRATWQSTELWNILQRVLDGSYVLPTFNPEERGSDEAETWLWHLELVKNFGPMELRNAKVRPTITAPPQRRDKSEDAQPFANRPSLRTRGKRPTLRTPGSSLAPDGYRHDEEMDFEYTHVSARSSASRSDDTDDEQAKHRITALPAGFNYNGEPLPLDDPIIAEEALELDIFIEPAGPGESSDPHRGGSRDRGKGTALSLVEQEALSAGIKASNLMERLQVLGQEDRLKRNWQAQRGDADVDVGSNPNKRPTRIKSIY